MGRPLNITQKLIESHLVSGDPVPGEEIGIRIDQTLTQDATGTLVMLELEAMNLDQARTEVSCQYVDHNLLQTDYRNADDHLFLKSAADRFGLWYSRPGNGVSHPIHTECFAEPGKTMAGSDSHTPATGCIGMLAFGAGGLDVAFAIAGEPLFLKMPKVLGVKLEGKMPPWVSAKDLVLEMLRRYDVKGCRGLILEYYGPGLKELSTMDRHVIANMGTEMGATTSVFPSDSEVRRFMKQQQREDQWSLLEADEGAEYDLHEEIVLDDLEPMIALPGSPGDVVPVREVEGRAIYQAYIGSSANPGYRDFWIASKIVQGRKVAPEVSFDINPTSRQIIENMVRNDVMLHLVESGARIHQAGCNGCIGMGQAPATGRNSLRTVPRNFPGRSGTREDSVYLVSPETAAASALTAEITHPAKLAKQLKISYPGFKEPKTWILNREMLFKPSKEGIKTDLVKGPNISTLPDFTPLEDFSVPVLLKLPDNISTDEILRAGAEVLPFRSNIPEISKFAFTAVDDQFYERSQQALKSHSGHVVVAGENYAQGSSREHAAIAPRYLGQKAVLAKSFARIGWQNLVNFGIIPLQFRENDDYEKISNGNVLSVTDIRSAVESGNDVPVLNKTTGDVIMAYHSMSPRQISAMLAGGVINYYRESG